MALNKTTLSLAVAAKETLTATVEPADATDKTVTWFSTDTGIAKVSDTGEVTGVAAGAADVTVTDGNKTATCAITVTAGA
ncbi:Ig-like domain-containing protein [Anaerostipes caccae]|uniref:Ig-like domain-containing protein n=1 Tax=Anaerostipes caccae TaxID=105841 RepID=UPI003AF086F1